MAIEIKTTCPNCNGHIAYGGEYIGMTVPCPHCSDKLTLPKTPAGQARWYYRGGRQTLGPCNTQQINNLLAAGAIISSTQVCREGANDWVKIGSLSKFQTAGNPKPSPAPTVQTISKSAPSSTSRPRSSRIVGTIAAAIVLLTGVAVTGWYYGLHLPHVRKIAEAREEARIRKERESAAANQAAQAEKEHQGKIAQEKAEQEANEARREILRQNEAEALRQANAKKTQAFRDKEQKVLNNIIALVKNAELNLSNSRGGLTYSERRKNFNNHYCPVKVFMTTVSAL